MIFNEHMATVFAENPQLSAMSGNLLAVPYVEAMDVTNVVTFLASNKARYITGVALPVDAGYAVM
jgi:enoyl-[acyl-carrier-protein] reductase (NADH)